MYQINVRVRGVSPILQHAFTPAILDGLRQAAGKKTAKQDYSYEWMDTMYAHSDGYLYQPASHIEGALVKAAARFKMERSRTYKDVMRAYVYAQPNEIPLLWHGECIPTPDESLLVEPTDALKVNIMRVVVQRAAVARARLEVSEGWELAFRLDVIEDILQAKAIQQILEEAGRAVGIGDYRPRYGRFEVVRFDVA